MNYKEQLGAAMKSMAQDPLNRFIGYGIKNGCAGQALGTLRGMPDEQLIETPVAENLMAGLAIGLSLAGFKPVLYYERADFTLNAADAIVNHLDKAAQISRGEFKPAVIIRVTIGNKTKPLFTGATHTQNFAEAFRSMTNIATFELQDGDSIEEVYRVSRWRQDQGLSTILFEFKDLF